MWLILGITGITGGGKTTLSTELYDYFTKLNKENVNFGNRRVNKVKIIHQDKYFHHRDSPKHIRIEEINYINREVLSAMDMELMWQDIENILNCRDDSSSLNNDNEKFSLHENMNSETDNDTTINILIIEGFLIFSYQPIFDLCHMKFFFQLPYDLCLKRRLMRSFKHVNPQPEYYFKHFLWPSYQKYFNEVKAKSNNGIVFLNGENTQDEILHQVLEIVRVKAADI